MTIRSNPAAALRARGMVCKLLSTGLWLLFAGSQMSQSTPVAEIGLLPSVRLEVRQNGRTTTYALDHVDFLIGAVPGCDLRVPGSDLPPVLCVLARRPGGLSLRKLAPTQLILVNGETTANGELADGDRITLGAVDIIVRMEAVVEASPADGGLSEARQGLQDQAAELRAQVLRFQEEKGTFEAERQRLLAAEAREEQATQPSAAQAEDPKLSERIAALDRQRQELAAQRQELADIRKQLYDRYQERRDRLAALQASVDHAAKKVQERKRALDEDQRQSAERRQELDAGQQDLSARAQELAQAADKLDKERQAFKESQNDLVADWSAKLAEVQAREQQTVAERQSWDERLRKYQSDVLRLDRRQGELEEREHDLARREQDFGAQKEKWQTDGAELEQQALRLDELRVGLEGEAERLAKQKEEQDDQAQHLSQRAALLEGQQATLAALRARLERVREEVRRQEQQLAEERTRQEEATAQLEQESQALLMLKSQLENEQALRDQDRQQMIQRQATLEAAVARLKEAQEQLGQREAGLAARLAELDRRSQELDEQEGVLQGRLRQVAETQERLDAERQALRERTLALTEAEQAREALQEQLRKRGEELAARHKDLAEKKQAYDNVMAGFDQRVAELDSRHEEALAAVAARHKELEGQQAGIQAEVAAFDDRRRELEKASRHLRVTEQELADQRQAWAHEQEAALEQVREREQGLRHMEAEFQTLRHEAKELLQQTPELELRAGAALDRLSHAREQLKDHLEEIHAYVRQCQGDLEDLRGRLQTEAGRLQDQEQGLREHQDEHRLSLAAFRQQLIGWQGHITDLKRSLAQGQTRLERRQAQVEEQVRQVDETAQQLHRQTEDLHEQRKVVAEHRQEMDRHLGDMRQWYRHKLRDLAGLDLASSAPTEVQAGDVVDAQTASSKGDEAEITPTGRHILSLTEAASPADQRLGEVLRDHELIDPDALTALLVEARRQRRSLRQVLLASGAVTLYQLALIEAGNVTGLMMGPVRVIDRLRATPHETVYRVFDPRRAEEAVLRVLAEDDAADTMHADEFRQRFGLTLQGDSHWLRALEVLDLDGRPAVLEEWVTGLPSGDWPPLAAAPGVCYRLLTQAALGLAHAHAKGLVHGRLEESSFVLSAEGMLRIAGLGDPAWLSGGSRASAPVADWQALGRIASTWCTPTGVRKGAKAKPLPDSLTEILQRLSAGDYSAGEALLVDLDRAGADIPANAEAWDRLLKYVGDHGAPLASLRQTA